VDVLHHQHVQLARRAGLTQQRAEQFFARSVGPAQLQQFAAERAGDVEEGAERSRGEHAVTRPPAPGGLRQAALRLLD